MITLDGQRLTLGEIVAVADGEPVQLGARARAVVRAGHELAVQIASERTVYGRTTGVGANKDTAVDAAASADHARRLLHSHATSAGPVRASRRVRATMAIRANQLAVGGSGARVDVLDALIELLNAGGAPEVREHGGVGTGDLGPLATIAVALPGVEWTADDALPFLSSNAATLADAALAVAELLDLAWAGIAVAATTFVAVGGAGEAFDPAVEAMGPYDGVHDVASSIRRLTAGSGAARRLQDPFALRCLPQVHGLTLDTLSRVVTVVEDAAAVASENPVVVAGSDRADSADEPDRFAHHGGFHAAYLASALDAARLAVAGSAGLSLRRVGLLLDSDLTGVAPFLGDGTPGASGAMGLEYAGASAVGDLRALGVPASLQTVSLSRGVEDDASYASLAARQALDAVAPYAVVLGCELVGAVRALRLQGRPAESDGWGAVLRACADLPGSAPEELADRDLTPDIDAAVALLPGLAGLAGLPGLAGLAGPVSASAATTPR